MNTINICIGHKGFPVAYARHVDIMLTPKPIEDWPQAMIIPPSFYGVSGESLSEYAQLFWLLENFDSISKKFEYVRLFHYRRFVAEHALCGESSLNQEWTTTIRPDELCTFEESFRRNSTKEVLNKPMIFNDGGMLMQYAVAHGLSDILGFTDYLLKDGLLNDKDAATFLTSKVLIPASSIGVFKVETFRKVMTILRRSANFMNSPDFVVRPGYQHRSMGFLLERLQSFLLLLHMQMHLDSTCFGVHIVMSDSDVVSVSL